MSDERILAPFGAPDRQAPAFADPLALTVYDRLTIIDLAVTATVTINLTVDAETPDGAMLIINVDQDATGRDVTLGTGFLAGSTGITGIADDKDSILAIYDASAGTFRVVSIHKTVDAA